MTALAIDVDGFKEVDDRLGDPAGDALLVLAADRLRAASEPDELLARRGGDDFAAIIPRTDRSRAERLASALVEAFSFPFPFAVADTLVSVGASIGSGRRRRPSRHPSTRPTRRCTPPTGRARAAGRSVERLLAPGAITPSRARHAQRA